MTLSAGTRLGPYEMLGLLGAGGMGEVYRARDTRLEREVAVKVLPAELSSDAARLKRFETEARLVSVLNHPNIVTIHEVGQSDSTSFIVMELVNGKPLRELLYAGPLPLRKVLSFAAQVADGLARAHASGIVHRDLKPENVMVTSDGLVKILDFGLAKLTHPDSDRGQAEQTQTIPGGTEPGVVMGTVGYMSPEQAAGQQVDFRSDQFSFGSILYEMATGKQAFERATRPEILAAIIRDEPEPISARNSEAPSHLRWIVERCLAKEPHHRYAATEDLARDLANLREHASDLSPTVTSGAQFAARPSNKNRVLIAVAAVVVLAAVGVFLMRRAHRGGGEAGGVKRVAVLPFENLGAAEDDYFADGITDEIRGKLTSLPGVEVIARGSSTPYKKTTKTPKQIAQELDVKYVLTATVRWQKGTGASRVHVTPELVEVRESGAPASKWQQPFDAAITDVFQVQSEIAAKVAQALGAALGAGEEKRLSEKPTQNLAAYDAFLKCEEIFHGGAADPPSLRKALGFCEQAVALDPGFAQAWARVSSANSLLYANGTPTPALAERARQAGERAVALAPNRPEGYLALGNYKRLVAGDDNRAMEQFEKGLRVAPGDASLVKGTAFAEQGLGRWDAAVDHFRQAVRLDPRSAGNLRVLGDALFRLRRYPEAREALDRGLALAPANPFLIENKALTYLGEGDLAGARAVLKAAPREVEPTALVANLANYVDVWFLDEEQRELLLRLTPSAFDDDRGNWALCLVQAYALKGDAANVRTYAEESRKAFEEQLRAAPNDARRHVVLGLALAYLGRKEEAIREGRRGVALDPVSKDADQGPYIQHQLVRIYILVGEQEKALDQLEPLLKAPYWLSPGWLKIDPNFDPLRKNPRFQKLVVQAK